MIIKYLKVAVVLLFSPMFSYAKAHMHAERQGIPVYFQGYLNFTTTTLQLLSEQHENAVSLFVPAMCAKSSGMELESQFIPQRLLVSFDGGSSQNYVKVNGYEEQF